MYSQAWSPTPSTTAVAPELRTQKRSPTMPPQEDLPRRGAVRDDVAGDDLLLGGERGLRGRCHDEATTRQTLAHVVVGIADEPQRDALRKERAEALSGRAGERDVDRVVGKPGALGRPGDDVAQYRPDRPVDVTDRGGLLDRSALLDRLARQLDELHIESLTETVVLGRRRVQRRGALDLGEDR